jgi:hypothetical protein
MKIFVLLFWKEKNGEKEEGAESWPVLTRSCSQVARLVPGFRSVGSRVWLTGNSQFLTSKHSTDQGATMSAGKMSAVHE